MADIMINFEQIFELADQLGNAGRTMHDAMMTAASAVQRAGTEMSGQLQNDAAALYAVMQGSNEQMTSDVAQAAQVLNQMAQTLKDADVKGAGNFHL